MSNVRIESMEHKNEADGISEVIAFVVPVSFEVEFQLVLIDLESDKVLLPKLIDTLGVLLAPLLLLRGLVDHSHFVFLA